MPVLNGIEDDKSYTRGLMMYEQIMRAIPDVEDGVISGDIADLLFIESVLGRALADYADQRWPLKSQAGGTPASIIRVIMDEHGLTQSDLPELGSQGVVSEILSGKREINLRQINALSERFGVPKHFFLS